MKKLLKIGALLLFIIGLFTVQLDFKPILVDDDGGIEFIGVDTYGIEYPDISTDNMFYFSSPSPGILAEYELGNTGHFVAPLKFPLSGSYNIKLNQTGNYFALNDCMITRNYSYTPGQLQSVINRQNRLTIGKVGKRKIRGLCRLEIGDNFYNNLIV